jgi:hypothetical protein
VVAAVHFFAMDSDESLLLDYLGEPGEVRLQRWPLTGPDEDALRRSELGESKQVMIVHPGLGQPRVLRPSDDAMRSPDRAGVFNRLNWARFHPKDQDGLVDSNASPVLLWQRGGVDGDIVRLSEIGSQADAMAAISTDDARWVNRVMGWIRRRGTRVWGLERDAVRPDIDVDLPIVNNVYAMPGALVMLESGGKARR